MRTPTAFIGCLFFVTTLAAVLSAGNLDDAIQAEVERPQLIPDSPQTAYLAGFTLTFDARFTNRSENSANVPDRDRGPDGAAWITLSSVQSRQNDGSWRFVVNPGTLMWKGDTRFAPCKSLRPKETLEIRSVSDRLVVYESQLARLGPKPTVRVSLVLSCRQQDGKILSKTVETDPFVLSIPARQ